ncbi:13930_t:CDS:2 [Entrophospora sp. SA101]|nr:15462_t:CDS:2 [Entrophospora sp. SA101]CAJ0865674.1 13930_t:CDS:2 [Entrophospora sp. SA101]
MKKLEKVILLQNNKLGKKYQTKEQQDKQVQADLILEEEAQKIYDKINNFALSFTLKKDEKGEPFGSVGFKEILAELEKSGFNCEKNQLVEFHPLNKLGENTVKVKLNILNKSPSPLNIEIEYEENEQNGRIYKRAVALYTDDDIIV